MLALMFLPCIVTRYNTVAAACLAVRDPVMHYQAKSTKLKLQPASPSAAWLTLTTLALCY